MQGSYGVATGKSQYLDKSGPSRIETVVHIQMASKVEILRMGQSGSERVIEIRGSLCYRVVIESLLGDYYIW